MNLSITSLDQFNFKGFQEYGSGAYGTVYVKNASSNTSRGYAVKVGEIEQEEVDALVKAAGEGLAPPVYGWFPNVRANDLPSEMRGHYFSNEEVSVLILARVVPLRKLYGWDGLPERVYSDWRNLERKLLKAGIAWVDRHGGNWGYYKGKPVVYDGLYLA